MRACTIHRPLRNSNALIDFFGLARWKRMVAPDTGLWQGVDGLLPFFQNPTIMEDCLFTSMISRRVNVYYMHLPPHLLPVLQPATSTTRLASS